MSLGSQGTSEVASSTIYGSLSGRIIRDFFVNADLRAPDRLATPTGQVWDRSCRNAQPRQQPHLQNQPDGYHGKQRQQVVHTSSVSHECR